MSTYFTIWKQQSSAEGTNTKTVQQRKAMPIEEVNSNKQKSRTRSEENEDTMLQMINLCLKARAKRKIEFHHTLHIVHFLRLVESRGRPWKDVLTRNNILRRVRRLYPQLVSVIDSFSGQGCTTRGTTTESALDDLKTYLESLICKRLHGISHHAK